MGHNLAERLSIGVENQLRSQGLSNEVIDNQSNLIKSKVISQSKTGGIIKGFGLTLIVNLILSIITSGIVLLIKSLKRIISRSYLTS